MLSHSTVSRLIVYVDNIHDYHSTSNPFRNSSIKLIDNQNLIGHETKEKLGMLPLAVVYTNLQT